MEMIPWKYLKYTQELGFRAPIHERVESRCIHHDGEDLDDDDMDDGGDDDDMGNGNMDDEEIDDEDTDEGTDKVSRTT